MDGRRAGPRGLAQFALAAAAAALLAASLWLFMVAAHLERAGFAELLELIRYGPPTLGR